MARLKQLSGQVLPDPPAEPRSEVPLSRERRVLRDLFKEPGPKPLISKD